MPLVPQALLPPLRGPQRERLQLCGQTAPCGNGQPIWAPTSCTPSWGSGLAELLVLCTVECGCLCAGPGKQSNRTGGFSEAITACTVGAAALLWVQGDPWAQAWGTQQMLLRPAGRMGCFWAVALVEDPGLKPYPSSPPAWGQRTQQDTSGSGQDLS